MNQASARFEQYLHRRFPQSTTPKHYLSDLHIFIAIIGDKTPADVTAEDIDRFVEHQIAAELTPTTINRRLATLHTFFEYLASEKPERDWPNPVIGRCHHLRTGFHLPSDLMDEDVDRLFAAIMDVRDRALFGLMVGAGLRVGEVASLRETLLSSPGGLQDGTFEKPYLLYASRLSPSALGKMVSGQGTRFGAGD